MDSRVTNVSYKAKADLPQSHALNLIFRASSMKIAATVRGGHSCALLLAADQWFSTRNLTEILLKTSNRSFQALCVRTLWNRSSSLWNNRQRNCLGLGHKCDVSRKVTQMVWTSKKKKKKTTNSQAIHKLFRKYTFFLSPCPSWRVLILFHTHKTQSLNCGGLWWLSLSYLFFHWYPRATNNLHTRDFSLKPALRWNQAVTHLSGSQLRWKPRTSEVSTRGDQEPRS